MTEFKLRKEFLSFHRASLGPDEKKEVMEVLDSGWLTTGPKTQALEKGFADYCGAREGMAVSSGTAALHLCMVALGISAGDEVIIPSFTFPCTANEILHMGAKPVFSDIEPGTFNISADTVESLITPQTRAIIPTHFGGHPCDLDPLIALCKKHGIALIEDACHAHGSEYKGKRIGGFDTFASCFSFYATKNLTTGEGGMITTNNPEIAKTMRINTLHGISRDAWKRYSKSGSWYYEVVTPGYKYNISDLQSALGLAQLKRLDPLNQKRIELAQIYDQLFQEIPEIETPVTRPYATRNGHLYPILGKNWNLEMRAQFIELMKSLNVGVSVHYIPTHRHPYYRDQFGLKPENYPVTEDVYTRIVSLPIYPDMTEEDVCYVVEAMKQVFPQLSPE